MEGFQEFYFRLSAELDDIQAKNRAALIKSLISKAPPQTPENRRSPINPSTAYFSICESSASTLYYTPSSPSL